MDDSKVVQHVPRDGSRDGSRNQCDPVVEVPAWWSGFLFHVLNARQVSMYLYLIMLCDERGVCHPTIEEIRKDLGLLSTTMVFESIAVLEEYGFFMRSRQALPESRSRRNVYRRASCEYTVLRLLETNKIDGDLHPAGSADPPSEDSRQLVHEGLREILPAEGFARYVNAAHGERRELLLELLGESLRVRKGGIYAYE